MKVTLDIKTNTVVVEGFHVSTQCMELVAEGVIQPCHNLGKCAVQPTFTVIQEGKPVPEVDNNFFLTTVPIERHDTVLFVSTFPRANRPAATVQPSVQALKSQILRYQYMCMLDDCLSMLCVVLGRKGLHSLI